jgi:hypothetical protein
MPRCWSVVVQGRTDFRRIGRHAPIGLLQVRAGLNLGTLDSSARRTETRCVACWAAVWMRMCRSVKLRRHLHHHKPQWKLLPPQSIFLGALLHCLRTLLTQTPAGQCRLESCSIFFATLVSIPLSLTVTRFLNLRVSTCRHASPTRCKYTLQSCAIR